MTTILLIAIVLLPAIIWFLFYFSGRTHKESSLWLILTFIAGIIVAFVSFSLEYPAESIMVAAKISKDSPIYFLSFAIIEEVMKFVATYLVTLKNKKFTAPADAMIYMVATSLGFATLENLGAAFGVGKDAAFANNIILGVLAIMILRFVGATLLHSLASAVVGYYWALDIIHFFERRYLIIGLILASLIHGIFNILIYQFGPISYPILFLAAIGFFVFGDFEKLRRINI